MKKKIIKSVLIVLALVLIHQIYWYINLGGNLDIYLNNSSPKASVNISLFLDGEKIIEDDFDNNYLLYKNFTDKVSLGKHHLVAKTKDGKIKNEFYFNSLFVKRIKVELRNEDSDEIDEEPSFHFYPEIVFGKFIIE